MGPNGDYALPLVALLVADLVVASARRAPAGVAGGGRDGGDAGPRARAGRERDRVGPSHGANEHPLPFSELDAAQLAALAPYLRLLAEFSPWRDGPGGAFGHEDAYYVPFCDFDGVVRPVDPRVRMGCEVSAAIDVSDPIATTTGGSSRHENCFDFLRLLAATCVLVQHSTLILRIPFLWHRPGANDWFADGVSLFFIISGMLVFRSAESCLDRGRPVRDYFVNRFLRIAPGLYAYALVITAMLMVMGALSLGDLIGRTYALWAASVLALYPVVSPPTLTPLGILAVNGPLWTIPVEVSFYLVVPLIVWGYRRAGLWPTIAAVWVVSIVTFMALARGAAAGPPGLIPTLYAFSFLPHVLFFTMGIVWAVCWPRTPQSPLLALAALACWLVVRYRLLGLADHLGRLRGPAWGIPLSYLAVWFGYHGPRLLSRLTATIGDLSFGIYIWHSIVINVLVYAAGVPWAERHALGAHALVFSGVLTMAGLSWWFIERPALRRKPFTSRADTTSRRSRRTARCRARRHRSECRT